MTAAARVVSMRRTATVGVVLVTLARGASADTPQPSQAAPAARSPDRQVPDYSGLGPPSSAGNAALWVPRVLLSPVYLVSEYVLRRPLSVAIPAAEHADLPEKIYNFFTFGPDHKVGVLPIALAEFNFNPSIGIYAFWNDAGFKGDSFVLHAEAWPADWVGVSLVQRVAIGKTRTLQFHVSGLRRPDQVFYGLGPTSLESHESRYGINRVDGGATYEWRFWRSSRVATAIGARYESTYDGHYGRDTSLSQEAATGAFAVPDGFGHGYTALYDGVVAAFDTRVPASRLGSGVRLELDAEQGSLPLETAASGWIRYGGTAAGYVDLDGHARVLGLALTTSFVDPLGSQPVPFTELVYLGGDHPMVGYYLGRLLDRSAAVATASYVWPIGPWLDGRIEVAVGNVFGIHLAALEPRLFRVSGALGLAVAGMKDPTTGNNDTPIELLVGVGTETFAQGAQMDSVRVMLGVPHTF
jgi:hypothetical protein